MADPRFFNRSASQALKQLASIAGAEIARGSPDLVIDDIASLDQAGAGQISFFDNIKYRDSFCQSKAAACIIVPDMVEQAPEGMALLVTSTPYKAFALVSQVFYPAEKPDAQIAPSAVIHPKAKIGQACVIESGVVIEENADIGDGTWIEPNAVIGRGVILGANCRVGANASLSHCMVGQGTRFYPGVRIGQDGFGFAIDPAGYVTVPQVGRVIIGDQVEIGANSCIDRGAGPDTVIGDGTWIDNLVQIGHNAKIGKRCVIVAQAGVAGSSVLQDYVVLAAQVGIAGHLTIGAGTRVGAQSGVMRDIGPGQEVLGSPALPAKQFMRQVVAIDRLCKKGNE